MKTIGIAADNYKIDKFKIELEKEGFKDIFVSKLFPQVKLIKIIIDDKDFESSTTTISRLCKKLQIDFNKSN